MHMYMYLYVCVPTCVSVSFSKKTSAETLLPTVMSATLKGKPPLARGSRKMEAERRSGPTLGPGRDDPRRLSQPKKRKRRKNTYDIRCAVTELHTRIASNPGQFFFHSRGKTFSDFFSTAVKKNCVEGLDLRLI